MAIFGAQMKTILQNSNEVGSSAYWGECGDWFIAAAVHRDSDCLDRSNFEVMSEILKSLPEVKAWDGEFTPVTIERFSHWAVGWIDYLVIDPACKAAVDWANYLREKLENYPILDEEHFSRLESDEAYQVWQNCYNERDRIKYIRAHRSQFDFHNFQDLIGCVRGKYFAGYASELIH